MKVLLIEQSFVHLLFLSPSLYVYLGHVGYLSRLCLVSICRLRDGKK